MSEWTTIRDEVSRRLWRFPVRVSGSVLLFFTLAVLLRALVAAFWALGGVDLPSGDYFGAVWFGALSTWSSQWLSFALAVLFALRLLIPSPTEMPVARVVSRAVLAAVIGVGVVVLVQVALAFSQQTRPASILAVPDAARLEVAPLFLLSLVVETLITGIPVVVMFALLARLKVAGKRG